MREKGNSARGPGHMKTGDVRGKPVTVYWHKKKKIESGSFSR